MLNTNSKCNPGGTPTKSSSSASPSSPPRLFFQSGSGMGIQHHGSGRTESTSAPPNLDSHVHGYSVPDGSDLSSDGLRSSQSSSGQLEPLMTAVKDLFNDLRYEGFEESEPQGILQALKGLRECLESGKETYSNAQTPAFIQLQAMLATLSAALEDPSKRSSIQDESVRIARILAELIDPEDGAPKIFGESQYTYDRSKRLLEKLGRLVNHLGATTSPPQQSNHNAPAMVHAKTFPQYNTRIYYNVADAEFKFTSDSSRPHASRLQDFRLGCDNTIHRGVDIDVQAPRMKLTRSDGASASLWTGEEIGDVEPRPHVGNQTTSHQTGRRLGAHQHRGQQNSGQGSSGPGSGGPSGWRY